MGGLFGGPDTAAQERAAAEARQAQAQAEARAEATRQKSAEQAALASAKQDRMEASNADRRRNVATSGRDATVLTDNSSKSLLGS